MKYDSQVSILNYWEDNDIIYRESGTLEEKQLWKGNIEFNDEILNRQLNMQF